MRSLQCSHQLLRDVCFLSQIDLSSKRVISSKDGQRWAKSRDLRFVYISIDILIFFHD